MANSYTDKYTNLMGAYKKVVRINGEYQTFNHIQTAWIRNLETVIDMQAQIEIK